MKIQVCFSRGTNKLQVSRFPILGLKNVSLQAFTIILHLSVFILQPTVGKSELQFRNLSKTIFFLMTIFIDVSLKISVRWKYLPPNNFEMFGSIKFLKFINYIYLNSIWCWFMIYFLSLALEVLSKGLSVCQSFEPRLEK